MEGNALAHIEGFGGRGGFGRRPALVVIDMTLGFTDPESPLACDLKGPISEIQKLLTAARRAEIPVSSSPPSPSERATNSPPPPS
jgi:nicotinamidase-related amidase